MDSKCLTTKEVARLCRVSNATVKRWEDSGLIESERTSGGHRRFRAEEIARFQQKQKLGIKHSPGDESVITAKTRRKKDKTLSDSELFHSLIAGREEEVANILINEFLNDTPLTEIFDKSISKAMNTIGELWYEGKVSVAQEHLATRSIMFALHKLRSVVPVEKPCNKLAMCFAIEGDFHELATHLGQMTFESVGWEVINFGANTPFFSIADEVIQHKPDAICVSSTILKDVERASREYKDFLGKISHLRTTIILGGQSFSDKRLHKRFPADFYPNTFSQVATILKMHS